MLPMIESGSLFRNPESVSKTKCANVSSEINHETEITLVRGHSVHHSPHLTNHFMLHLRSKIGFVSGRVIGCMHCFKQVRHYTCCLSMHAYVHCIAYNCMFSYVPRWISSNA